MLRFIGCYSVLGMGIFAINAFALNGRVLEAENRDPVPQALVAVSTGDTVSTDNQGYFNISPTSINKARAQTLGDLAYRFGSLYLVLARDAEVKVELLSSRGKSLSSLNLGSMSKGNHKLTRSIFPGSSQTGIYYVRVSIGHRSVVKKILKVSDGSVRGDVKLLVSEPEPKVLAKLPPGTIDVSKPLLLPEQVAYANESDDVGDIVLNYPPRASIGVGAARPYGTTVLFDGIQGTAVAAQELLDNWQDWQRFDPQPTRQFLLARDPEFLNDNNRVTLQSCCNTLWGYDDIQATVGLYEDVQVHVEFIGMGEYDNPRDIASPDANENDPFSSGQPGYINSGVYVASRYEIQIEAAAQSGNLNNHAMGSIVDQYASSSNQNRPNGEWQAYDITYQGARFAGNSMTTNPRMTVWWNGVQIHNNRLINAGASGLSNHSGEEHNDQTIYGLKLQSEGRDVRFRNIWVKKLTIDDGQTNYGY